MVRCHCAYEMQFWWTNENTELNVDTAQPLLGQVWYTKLIFLDLHGQQ